MVKIVREEHRLKAKYILKKLGITGTVKSFSVPPHNKENREAGEKKEEKHLLIIVEK